MGHGAVDDLKEQASRDGDLATNAAGHDRRARRQHDLGLRPDVLRAGVSRRRHHRRHEPHALRRAARDRWPAPSTQDFDAIPLPTRPVVSFVQTPHDRIAIEIMRGCPWQCRFCQSTVIKRPLRVRSVETIVQAALESYRNTGNNEISLLQP